MYEYLKLFNKLIGLVLFMILTYSYHVKKKDINIYEAMLVILLVN